MHHEQHICRDLNAKRHQRGASGAMNLTPPSQLAFVLSVFLVILALLVRYAHVAIPVVSNNSFETLLAGFLLLLAGVMFRGF
jgi:hypothetical protein